MKIQLLSAVRHCRRVATMEAHLGRVQSEEEPLPSSMPSGRQIFSWSGPLKTSISPFLTRKTLKCSCRKPGCLRLKWSTGRPTFASAIAKRHARVERNRIISLTFCSLNKIASTKTRRKAELPLEDVPSQRLRRHRPGLHSTARRQCFPWIDHRHSHHFPHNKAQDLCKVIVISHPCTTTITTTTTTIIQSTIYPRAVHIRCLRRQRYPYLVHHRQRPSYRPYF